MGSGAMTQKRKLVFVGNGMAGMRAIEELLKLAPDLYDITVFGSEPHGNYNRILLSPVLAAEKTVADIMLNTREWYAENGITLHAGDEVVRIDRARRRVIAKSGARSAVRPVDSRDGLEPDRAAAARQGARRRRQLSRHRGRRPHDRCVARVQARRRHRRRFARARSGVWPAEARHGRHGRAPRRHADGAAARRVGRRAAAALARGARARSS